jgi:hypothetical protein
MARKEEVQQSTSMLMMLWIDLFNDYITAIRAKRIGLLWIKGNHVHSGHLDFVRGRQATVVIRVSELLGIRR